MRTYSAEGEKGKDAVSTMEGAVDRLEEELMHLKEKAKKINVKKAAKEGASEVKETVKGATSYAKDNPKKAILIVVAVLTINHLFFGR